MWFRSHLKEWCRQAADLRTSSEGPGTAGGGACGEPPAGGLLGAPPGRGAGEGPGGPVGAVAGGGGDGSGGGAGGTCPSTRVCVCVCVCAFWAAWVGTSLLGARAHGRLSAGAWGWPTRSSSPPTHALIRAILVPKYFPIQARARVQCADGTCTTSQSMLALAMHACNDP